MISNRVTPRKHIAVFTTLVTALAIAAGCRRAAVTGPPPEVAATVDPWKEAVAKVEQERGEPVGRNATVLVPDELRHYADRRRFLAVQAADTGARVTTIPKDFAGLAPMIKRREFIELKPLDADYILYGVGQNVGGDPFTHYDQVTHLDLPFATTQAEVEQQVQRDRDSIKQNKATLAYLKLESRRASRRDPNRKAALRAQVEETRKAIAMTAARSKLFNTVYSDPPRRKLMLDEYQELSNLARDFDGETYDLNDPDARRRMKMRLLDFIRPEARELLIQIAHGYREKFDRPLPISSLLRTVQYQHELAGTNANAARGSAPPHSTGLAFDIYYGYMSTAEQEYLFSVIARLKNGGRVEALREARDNIHVYVFAGGEPPNEKLIAAAETRARSRRYNKRTRAVSR